MVLIGFNGTQQEETIQHQPSGNNREGRHENADAGMQTLRDVKRRT